MSVTTLEPSGRRSKPPLAVEFFDAIEPPIDSGDFVQGLLCKAGLSIVFGESGCGKTHFAVDLAFHVATGRTWFGKEIDAGGVLYVAAGGGPLRKRIAALRRTYTLDDPDVPFAVIPQSIDLRSAGGDLEALRETVKTLQEYHGINVTLIVIDTLSRVLAGGDENSSEAMGSFVRALDQLRDASQAHVLVVHHSGKDASKGARGHSLIRAAVDTEIEVSRDTGSKIVTAKVTKQRDLDCDGEFCFVLETVELGTDRRGNAITSCIVKPAEVPKGPKRVSLSPKNRDALEKLHDLLIRSGRPAPQNDHYPSRAIVVSVDAWRQHLKDSGVLSGEAPAIRQGWKRIFDSLREAGEVACWQDLVWSVSANQAA